MVVGAAIWRLKEDSTKVPIVPQEANVAFERFPPLVLIRLAMNVDLSAGMPDEKTSLGSSWEIQTMSGDKIVS